MVRAARVSPLRQYVVRRRSLQPVVRDAGPRAERTGGPFGDRNVIAMGSAFGETFFYYTTRDPATGRLQRKVTFVKMVVVYGLPIPLGSGYYLDQ